MKNASLAWDELGRWILFLLVALAIVILIIAFSGGIGSVWEKIKIAMQMRG